MLGATKIQLMIASNDSIQWRIKTVITLVLFQMIFQHGKYFFIKLKIDMRASNCEVNGSLSTHKADYQAIASHKWLLTLSGHTLLAISRRPPCDHDFRWSRWACRGIARRSPIGCRGLREVALAILSQGGFARCKLHFSATKLIVERFLFIAMGGGLVGDWLSTCFRSVAVVADNTLAVSSRRPVTETWLTSPQTVANLLWS